MKLGHIKMVSLLKNAYTRIINKYYVFDEEMVGPTEFDVTIEEAKEKYRIKAWMKGINLGLSVTADEGTGATKEQAKEIERDIKEY